MDNSSSDDSCEILNNKFPFVKLIQNDKNVGFSKANNLGVSKAKGKYICILNPENLSQKKSYNESNHLLNVVLGLP